MTPLRQLLCAFAVLAALGPASIALGAAEPKPPNIVLILADDHAYPYFEVMGDTTVVAPSIDRLIDGGTTFTIGYNTASVCLPSLITLLDGTEPYARRHTWSQPGAPLAERSLPGLLARQGYKSLQSGKFWVSEFSAGGFTAGTKGPDVHGRPFQIAMGGAEGLKVGRTTMAPVYDFLNDVGDDPFFLWFAPELPHGPWDAPERYLELYRDAEIDDDARQYYASISWLDDSVGALVDYLDHKGLRENTLIIYLSDNGQGPFEFEGDPVPKGRRSKSTLFELGFRTPIVFNWPGHVPAGVVREDLVSTLDVVPTLLNYGGVAAPGNLTGIDLRENLEQQTPVDRRKIVGRARGRIPGFEPEGLEGKKWKPALAFYVRDPRWHYIWYDGLDLDLLFDLQQDAKERVNVVAEHAELVAGFRADIEKWRTAPIPEAAASAPESG